MLLLDICKNVQLQLCRSLHNRALRCKLNQSTKKGVTCNPNITFYTLSSFFLSSVSIPSRQGNSNIDTKLHLVSKSCFQLTFRNTLTFVFSSWDIDPIFNYAIILFKLQCLSSKGHHSQSSGFQMRQVSHIVNKRFANKVIFALNSRLWFPISGLQRGLKNYLRQKKYWFTWQCYEQKI